MKVGLIDIEPKITNTAYMQIAHFHKERGDTVEWAAPLEYDTCDLLVCSSLFSFTDKTSIPAGTECGGTGFDLKTKLRVGIGNSDLDYSIYPKCKTSYLWFSRGCVRNCSFCIVRQKEGGIKAVLPKNLNPNGEYITVMDNNFFASPAWESAIGKLQDYQQEVNFQGVDVRLLTPQMCKALNTLRHAKQIKIAWDNPREDLVDNIALMLKYVKAYKIMCYVLIGHTSNREQDLARVECLRKFKIDPFVMPMDKTDTYQKRFARWVNHKAIFRTVKWKDYK